MSDSKDSSDKPKINWAISEPKYSFDDIILQNDTSRELHDVISYEFDFCYLVLLLFVFK